MWPTIAVDDLRHYTCLPATIPNRSGLNGTVPHPTAIAGTTPNTSTAVQRESFAVGTKTIANQVDSWITGATENWGSLAVEQQSGRIQELTVRISTLCNAWRTLRSHDAVTEVQHATGAAALKSVTTIIDEWIDTAPTESSTLVESLVSKSEIIASIADSAITAIGGQPIQETTVFYKSVGVSMNVPDKWVTTSNQSTIQLSAPYELQQPNFEEPGLQIWELGTGLQLSRIQLFSEVTADRIDLLVSTKLRKWGEVQNVSQTTVDGEPTTITRLTSDSGQGWTTFGVHMVRAENLYIIELGCPANLESDCGQILENILRSIVFE